jgi:NAD/NADP transhydrogenase alpha subunit
MKRRTLLLLGATVALVVGLSGGAAFAYFTSSGSGSGTATVAGAPSPVTIATNATPASPLQPGGTGDLVITATNPNPYAVQITALTIGAVTGCTTPAVSLVTPSSSYLPLTIPANASSQRLVIAGSLTMGLGASNDCQVTSLTIPLTATVQK